MGVVVVVVRGGLVVLVQNRRMISIFSWKPRQNQPFGEAAVTDFLIVANEKALPLE